MGGLQKIVPERSAVVGSIVMLLAILAYANTFQAPFVLDDTWITDTPALHNLGSFLTGAGYDEFPNRFIGYLTLALNYAVGGDNVIGYHAVNLAIHSANGLLVCTFAALILRTPLFGSTFKVQSSDADLHPSPFTIHPFLPLLTALLFVSHPVQTQAVTYIVQRLTSLATLLYLASLVCHLRWRLSRLDGAPFLSRPVLPWWLLSLACALLAMKTKEIAFTLPLAILLCEFSFFGRPDRKLLLSLVPLLLTILIIPLGMLTLQKPAGEILTDVRSVSADQYALSRSSYLFTQFSVVVTYLRLLLFPVNQNLDYDYPISRSLLEPRTALSLLLLLSLLALALFLWNRSRCNGITSPESPFPSPGSIVPSPGLPPLPRLASFGILWFFLTLSVESSIIPIRDVIFEHRLYLPSVGFLMAGGSLILAAGHRLSLRLPRARLVTTLLICLTPLLLAGATFARNSVWQTEEALWNDTVRKSPRKARPWNNLGVVLAKQHRLAEAIRAMERSVRLDPAYLDGRLNLGQAYAEAERFADAERELRIAVGLSPAGDNAAREALQELLRVLTARGIGPRWGREP